VQTKAALEAQLEARAAAARQQQQQQPSGSFGGPNATWPPPINASAATPAGPAGSASSPGTDALLARIAELQATVASLVSKVSDGGQQRQGAPSAASGQMQSVPLLPPPPTSTIRVRIGDGTVATVSSGDEKQGHKKSAGPELTHIAAVADGALDEPAAPLSELGRLIPRPLMQVVSHTLPQLQSESPQHIMQ
jgi:hypothetical protein